MFNRYKRYFIIALFVFLSLGITQGAALGTKIPIDAIADAGIYPGEGAYVKFVKDTNNTLINTVSPSETQQWTTAQSIYDYASYNNISEWILKSAGNIWSSDLTVGYSITGLSAGTYRISPEDGAYMYDALGWTCGQLLDYSNKYWWELHIKVQDNSGDSYHMLGSYDFQSSATSAFNAVKNSYIDISVSDGGSLSFWIWDWNSVDNSGGLTFNVTSVPEPSTFLLLVIGLSFLIRGKRN